MRWVWLLRACWASLPGTAGPLLGEAVGDASDGVRLTVVIGCWAGWAVVLLATLVPHPVSLTVVRIAAPASVAAMVWSTVAHTVDGWAALALSVTLAGTAVALTPQVAAVFVDGASYGDERRLPLRPPGALLLGPIQLAWAAAVVGTVAGPLLLAAHRWILGAVALVLGVPVAGTATRALHGLAKRWIVFVPAGMVLHDRTVLREPVLFSRRSIAFVGPALADSTAEDLTQGALGLALECRLRAPHAVVPAARRSRPVPEPRELDAFLFTPSLPGELLAEAERRRLPVG